MPRKHGFLGRFDTEFDTAVSHPRVNLGNSARSGPGRNLFHRDSLGNSFWEQGQRGARLGITRLFQVAIALTACSSGDARPFSRNEKYNPFSAPEKGNHFSRRRKRFSWRRLPCMIDFNRQLEHAPREDRTRHGTLDSTLLDRRIHRHRWRARIEAASAIARWAPHHSSHVGLRCRPWVSKGESSLKYKVIGKPLCDLSLAMSEVTIL